MSDRATFARRGAVGLLVSAAILFGAIGAKAQDPETHQGARTARLSLAEGHVRLSQGDQPVSDQALPNTPLFEGAQISTADDARAEIQFDDGSIVRVPPSSAVTLSVLGADAAEVTLNNGIGYFELQGSSSGSSNANSSLKVRFDNSVATASSFTVLRVKMDTPPGTVAVFSGNAHLEGEGAQANLQGGESVTLGVSSAGQFVIAENIEPDSWDAWNSDRDQALNATESAELPDTSVPQQKNPAWGDLSANGSWYNVPDQGYVWSPYEASNPGWDPYGVGYWMWTPGYGYLWVSGYSWGYMPYQCGYWNWYDSFGWGWSPGGCHRWTYYGGHGGYLGGDYPFNVGTSPRWYRLPVKPRLPQPPDPNNRHRVRVVAPQPIIPVTRQPQRGGPVTLPPRDRTTPVLLGGRPAQPIAPRSIFRPQPIGGNPNSGRPIVLNGGGRQGSVPEPRNDDANPSRPIYPRGPVYRPAPGGPSANPQAPRPMPRPMPMPSDHRNTTPPPMPPSGVSRPAPAPAPAPAPRPAPVYHPAPSGGGGGHVSAPAPSAGGRPAPPSAPSHK